MKLKQYRLPIIIVSILLIGISCEKGVNPDYAEIPFKIENRCIILKAVIRAC
jgi:hypothetical protein